MLERRRRHGASIETYRPEVSHRTRRPRMLIKTKRLLSAAHQILIKLTRNLPSWPSPAESPENLICGEDPRCCSENGEKATFLNNLLSTSIFIPLSLPPICIISPAVNFLNCFRSICSTFAGGVAVETICFDAARLKLIAVNYS